MYSSSTRNRNRKKKYPIHNSGKVKCETSTGKTSTPQIQLSLDKGSERSNLSRQNILANWCIVAKWHGKTAPHPSAMPRGCHLIPTTQALSRDRVEPAASPSPPGWCARRPRGDSGLSHSLVLVQEVQGSWNWTTLVDLPMSHRYYYKRVNNSDFGKQTYPSTVDLLRCSFLFFFFWCALGCKRAFPWRDWSDLLSIILETQSVHWKSNLGRQDLTRRLGTCCLARPREPWGFEIEVARTTNNSQPCLASRAVSEVAPLRLGNAGRVSCLNLLTWTYFFVEETLSGATTLLRFSVILYVVLSFVIL